MSGKNLVILGRGSNRELAASDSQQGNERHNSLTKLDQIAEDLLNSEDNYGNTIEEILQHPQVKKHGLLGRLSGSQQSLVTSVVSLMQDKVSTDAQSNAEALKQVIIQERETLKAMSHTFAATAKSLYKLPLLSVARQKREDIDASHFKDEEATTVYPDQDPPAPPTFFERFLTWGNLLSLTAILLAVLVVKTSVETANFETQYRLTQANLDQLTGTHHQTQQDLLALQKENKELGETIAAQQVRLEEQEKQILASTHRHEQDRSTQSEALAGAQQQLQKQSEQLEDVKSQNAALQQQLAAIRGKESQQDENHQLWKSLAEERKIEIEKLQSQLLELASAKKTKDKPSFLGIF